MPEEYVQVKQWVNFQVILMYVVIFLSLLMFLCMRSMQKKVTRNNEDSNQKAGDKNEWANKFRDSFSCKIIS